eukprot:jgi/Tetstr1/442287/TSEL_030428.t1
MGRRHTPRRHFRGCRMLPYMDDFMFFASSRTHDYGVRDRITSLLGKLDLSRHPDKGQWEPPVETVYMHVDSSSYGWGEVLNETTEECGFCYDGDRELHITYKELKAVLYAVLRTPSSRSCELWFILGTNDISIRARYLKITANI